MYGMGIVYLVLRGVVTFLPFRTSAPPLPFSLLTAHVPLPPPPPSHPPCLQVSDSFPYEWIKKKWKEGFFVTSLATSNQQWAVVMSRTSGFVDQAVELDFQYPSEGIHKRWDAGCRITACAATHDQVRGSGRGDETGSERRGRCEGHRQA